LSCIPKIDEKPTQGSLAWGLNGKLKTWREGRSKKRSNEEREGVLCEVKGGLYTSFAFHANTNGSY